MSHVIAVDPGIRGCGISRFTDGKLTWCAYMLNPVDKGAGVVAAVAMAKALEHCIWPRSFVLVEWPQTYGGRAAKGDANDLFPLAGVDAAICMIAQMNGCTYENVTPHEWKGSVPKGANNENAIIRNRVESRLDQHELAVFHDSVDGMAKKYGHNVIDAVGIGLHAVGRFDRKRVIARE